MTKFIMLVGLPASGKSTVAEYLKNNGFTVHSSDSIREELFADVNAQDNNSEVFSILHKRVKHDLSKGISCVYDATNMSMKRRKVFLDEIKKFDCEKICMLFAISVEICKERNQERDRQVSDEVYDKMLKSFWVPMYYEGWDRIVFITEKNYNYYYPIDKTMNFEQHNKHHQLKLFDHMFQAAKYVCNYSDNEFKKSQRYKNLIAATLNHDIGKLFTQTFVDKKGRITEDAHYYGHESYGTYIYLLSELYSVIDTELTSELYDIMYRTALINWHMRPLIVWKQSEKARMRDRKLIGEDMYNDIMLLHEADLAAH